MNDTSRERTGRGGEAGFTLVEALVAVVVLIFGLMAVTNLMLVAASSNSVANQGTAAVTSATRAMDALKAVSFTDLGAGGQDPFDGCDTSGAKDCNDPTLAPGVVAGAPDWHCIDSVPGVGVIHTHWWITADADARLLHIRVRSEGTGALSGARSRAEFTTFRACTNSDTTTGGCPEAP
jgi:type II secretory pathway pseudopilin PulG